MCLWSSPSNSLQTLFTDFTLFFVNFYKNLRCFVTFCHFRGLHSSQSSTIRIYSSKKLPKGIHRNWQKVSLELRQNLISLQKEIELSKCYLIPPENIWKHVEAVVQMCSVKKVFLKISQNSHENTCDRDSEIFVKFLRTPFYMEQLRWLLLYFYLHQLFQIKTSLFYSANFGESMWESNCYEIKKYYRN